MESVYGKKKMWNRDFTMVVLGQIISLFGNAILRFALPLYLLNETGSAALFGMVSACAFIPMIILAPIGGIFADRVNKRNIMVILDFSTALLVTGIILLNGNVNIVALLFTALFLLYGIQGAYQPAVQASIPALLSGEQIMQGNAVINLVSSLCGGMGAGMFANKWKAGKGYLILFYDALTLIPIGLAVLLPIPAMLSYVIIMVSCFVMMFLATLFSIQIMSYLQMIVPGDLIGKEISCAMCIGMCASPIGQAIYGSLFEVLKDGVYIVFFVATGITAVLAVALKKTFGRLEELLKTVYMETSR